MPAHRGVKVIVPLLNFLNKKNKFKIHYILIGGWLPSLVKNNSFMKKQLLKIDYIYVENTITIRELNILGIKNTFQMNNFKNLTLSSYKKNFDNNEFRCCIFSRIEEKKGITDAATVINIIKNKYNKNLYLDLYGAINEDYKRVLDGILRNNDNINYKGVVDSDKSVETIEKYDMLLFPTKYYTEGIPGTIIDAFFAGVPILYSNWENSHDILKNNYTGIEYKFNDINDFVNKLLSVINKKSILYKYSHNCQKEALKYTPQTSMIILYTNINNNK